MPMNILFQQLVILMIIIIVGYIGGKKGIITDDGERVLSNILLKISIPATILVSGTIDYSDEIAPNISVIFVIAMIFFLLSIFISNILGFILHLNNSRVKGFISSVVFSNIAFIGYPFADAIYGEEGVLYTSIILLVYSIYMWTYGIYLFSNTKKIMFSKFVNPCTIATVIMLCIFYGGIKVPFVILNPIKIIGNITVPLSMFVIGFSLKNLNLSSVLKEKSIIVISFLRLLILPALLYFVLRQLITNKTILDISVIMSALPCGSLNLILAKEYNTDDIYVLNATFLSMILFIATMPVIILMLSYM